MYPGRCIKCGAFDGLGEHDAMCENCYEQTRWEEITAINCNPQVDEIEDEPCPDCGFDPCECDTDDPDYWGEDEAVQS